MILFNWQQVCNNKQDYHKPDKDAKYHMHFQITTIVAEKVKWPILLKIRHYCAIFDK
jgi:hypothetical protein